MTSKTPTRTPLTGTAPAAPEVTRLFCTDCGTRNSADSKYCKECGGKINDGYRTMMLSIEDVQAIDDEQGQQRMTRLLDMAFWHNEAGHLDSAIRAAEAALVIHPNSTTAHSLLGTLYEKKGDDDKAIEHFEAVVALNPESAADAAKLEQVRRGVHVKAVAQPPTYKWVPPALAGLKWDGIKSKFSSLPPTEWKGRLGKSFPAVAAGAATVLVLGVGWLAIRPSGTATHRTVRVTTGPPTPLPSTAAANSAFGSGSSVAGPNRGLAPLVLKSVPSTKTSGAGSKTAALPPDPFAETLAPGTPVLPLSAVGKKVRRVASARVGIGQATSLLPPLTGLHAVPLPSNSAGLAPAPVAVSGMASVPSAPPLPAASVAAMPQHTVVVPRLGGAQTASYPGPAPAVQADSDGSASGGSSLSSHIHISINSSPSSEAITISDNSNPARHFAQGGGDDGDSYQQAALQWQQQGDYKKARASYQKAIRAFKAQIAAGRDVEAAKRGLQTSQTGLQICEQSQ